MWTASRSIDSRTGLTLLALGALLILATLACHPRRLTVLVVPIAIELHDINLWRDEDVVCVAEPVWQAVYVHQRCLSMRTIRGLILAAHLADDPA